MNCSNICTYKKGAAICLFLICFISEDTVDNVRNLSAVIGTHLDNWISRSLDL